MASSHRSCSRYTRLAEVALAALVVVCPLALGGAARWVSWPLMGLAGVAALLAGIGARRQGQSLRFPLLAVPLAVSAVLCAAQLVPLPQGVLRLLSPESAALREFALEPLGLTGARPVSLDPSATWRELSKHLAYLLTFLAAVQVCRARDSRRRLLAVVAFSGAAVVVVGLGHGLLGVHSLFGLRPWVHARPPLVTFFANPNHLAGFLGLAASVGVGLALTTRPRSKALPFALAAGASGLGVVLSLSRGGIVFFLFGQALLMLWLMRQRREGGSPWWARSTAALLGLLAVLAVGAYVAADQLWAEARSADSLEKLGQSKVSLWPMMARAALEFPVLGMGRGAFEAAFPRYQSEPNPNTLTHPENAVLQAATELGLPGLLLLAVAVWGFVRLVRRDDLDALELAVLAGVAALGLHNLFDFSWELPACAVATLLALGAVARPRERGKGTEGAQVSLTPSPVLLGSAVALTAVGLVALVPGAPRLADAEQALAALVAARGPVDAVHAKGLELIDLHPSDYLLYRLVASAHASRGGEGAGDTLAFVNRALYLSPRDSVSHRVAGRALLSLGRRSQGFLEYRLAHEAGDAGALLGEAIRRARTVEDLAAMTPASAEVAGRIVDSLGNTPGRQELALAYGAWAREHFEGRHGVTELWAREARLRLLRKELLEAEAACAEVERREPERLDTALLRAEVLKGQGERDASLGAVEALRARHPGNVELAFTLASWQLEAGLTRRSRETLQSVGGLISDYRQRALLLSLEADGLEREGLLSRAVERRQTAARLVPSADAYFAVARLQETLRRYDAAARSVREGLGLLPPDSREAARAWVSRLESAEKARVDTRRKELMDDPRAQELEQLLGGPREPPVEP